MNKWRIEYDNEDYGADETIWRKWTVTDGDKSFESHNEEDAVWLCGVLNKQSDETVRRVLCITERLVAAVRDFQCGHKPNGIGGKCDACEALKEWDALSLNEKAKT